MTTNCPFCNATERHEITDIDDRASDCRSYVCARCGKQYQVSNQIGRQREWEATHPQIDLDKLHAEPHFICEWCKPSDIPEREPERCAILYCSVHGCKTWHWPA